MRDLDTLTSRDNPRIKHLHALATSARDRRKYGETLLDGAHLIQAALQAGQMLKGIFVSATGLTQTEIVLLIDQLADQSRVTQLPDALFAHVSPVDTPSGVMALIDVPANVTMPPESTSLVVLDAVQDPGNLGTILRTAAAAGIRCALLTPGCAQAWSPRVLRSGMGAHFQLSLREQVDALAALEDYPGKVLATGLTDGARSLYATDLSGPVAWLFGAEGQGVSAALLARADEIVTIPMAAGSESLNVGAAAAVCLFEQVRQSRG
ncbi:MAG: RNA methyltransferase [Azoarcus sp.]|nr:RNA methyltransferase [Azoarcus sp.]